MNATILKEHLLTSDTLLKAYSVLYRTASQVSRLAGRREPSIRLWLRSMRATSGLVSPAPGVAHLRELLAGLVYRSGKLVPISRNQLLQRFAESQAARDVRRQFDAFPLADRVRLRFPTPPDEGEDPERLGDLMVLKRGDPETAEKGVVQIAYTEAIERFMALYDVASLARRYRLVLEPSWWGYQDMTFLRLLGRDLDVWVESPSEPDDDFLRALDSNLVPIELGFGDWVDPEMFQPKPGDDRSFDLVMVSSWNPVKRHDELFETLRTLRDRDSRSLRVALIGYPADWTRDHIEAMARHHGVLEMCEIFEAIPPERVAAIVADSRAFVLLSRREGGNRAIYEALFCDTPVIVYRRHRGVNLRHIHDGTGATFETGELDDAIRRVLDEWNSFHPRAWALANTGWRNSSRLLNERVRQHSLDRGEPWTEDLAPRRNLPNLRYAREGDHARHEESYAELASFLR